MKNLMSLVLGLGLVACGAPLDRSSRPLHAVPLADAAIPASPGIVLQGALQAVRNSELQKITGRLHFDLALALDTALRTTGKTRVTFSSETTLEVAQSFLGSHTVALDATTFETSSSLQKVLELTSDASISGIQWDDAIPGGEEAPSSAKPESDTLRIEMGVDSVALVKAARLEKLGPKALEALEVALAPVLAREYAVIAKFSKSVSVDQASSLLGGTVLAVIGGDAGEIVTAQASLAALLVASTRPEVRVIEGSRPLQPNPAISVR